MEPENVAFMSKSKDRQYNDQSKKDKRTNNNLQITTLKSKDRETRISFAFNLVPPLHT
jgi:hypothetical protein